MFLRLLQAITCVMLAAISVAVEAEPDPIFELKKELQAELQKIQPQSWSVIVDSNPDKDKIHTDISIKRDSPVLAQFEKSFPNPGPDKLPQPIKIHEFEYYFRIVPFVTKEEFIIKTQANNERRKEIAVLQEKLKGIHQTRPSSYKPRTPEETARVAEFSKYLDEHPYYELPTHYWNTTAFVIFDLFDYYDSMNFANKSEEIECKSMRSWIEKFLTPYDKPIAEKRIQTQ